MFEIKRYVGAIYTISDKHGKHLHSDGSIYDVVEFFPTQEAAQKVLDKYYPKPEHVWKQIPGYLNYSITSDGRVWSKPRMRTSGGWLKPNLDVNGYLCVDLGSGHRHRIHRLVLETYGGPCPANMVCRHLNGNQTDNRLENLCWGTVSENAKDAVKHGTCNLVGKYGEEHSQSKLSNQDRQSIIYQYSTGLFTQLDLAVEYGVCINTIYMLVAGKQWPFIDVRKKNIKEKI